MGGIGGGSSPLVRGSASRQGSRPRPGRFIPARAGIGQRASLQLLPPPVHPRSCGDRVLLFSELAKDNGSSPLVRGSGTAPPTRWCTTAVHPRSCGDRALASTAGVLLTGSSPLVRGSDRGRKQRLHVGRFIPARAGIGCWVAKYPKRPPVHPRSCGDRIEIGKRLNGSDGSSPLVRGSAPFLRLAPSGSRFIPARAGIGASSAGRSGVATVHPRSCGDRDTVVFDANGERGSSPLVRGSGHPARAGPAGPRFIPARAGIGYLSRNASMNSAVHPRSCGDRTCCRYLIYMKKIADKNSTSYFAYFLTTSNC